MIAEVFRTGGVCGFGLRSRQQAILCLPGDPEAFLPLLLREGYAFLGDFLGREIHTMELAADGADPQQLYRQMDGENLPMALEYNLVSTREGQRLRLIAPERGLLYLGAETAERYLSDAGEEPAAVRNPAAPRPIWTRRTAPGRRNPWHHGLGEKEQPPVDHRRAAAAVVLLAAACRDLPLYGA